MYWSFFNFINLSVTCHTPVCTNTLVQMNAMYEYVLAKRRAMEAQARALEESMDVKPKYEYDSDEETEGGTWEHKRRVLEMEATKGFALRLMTFCF